MLSLKWLPIRRQWDFTWSAKVFGHIDGVRWVKFRKVCLATELKADRLHLRDYPHTLTDSRHKGNQQTNKWTDGRMLPSALPPCIAVDNYGGKYARGSIYLVF